MRPVRSIVFGDFAPPPTPTICLFNQAVTPLGFDLGTYAAALQLSVDQYFAPIWGTPIHVVAGQPQPGMWQMPFLETADQPGALAYHDVTPDGFPICKVFVGTIAKDNSSLSVAAAHELFESLADPMCNKWANDSSGKLYAWESCDPVEETDFPVNGFRISNFITPQWFDGFRKPGSAKFDFLGHLAKPFQLEKGGYAIVEKGGKVTQVFGSTDKERRFALEDRRMHRSETRKIARVK